jgi:hypothetical protein
MTATEFDEDFASPGQWARLYRATGLQVVPAKTPTEDNLNWKRPALPEWRQLEYELAPDLTFARWYGDDGQHASRANMGMITGACSGRVFVVDLDTHTKPQAAVWWAGLLAVHANGLDFETPRQTTGGGGKQLLFRAPIDWTPPTFKSSLGVDVRGQGGFAMLPPSLHASGKEYAWDAGCEPWCVEIADAPAWLCEAISALAEEHGGTPQAQRERVQASGDVTAFGRDLDGREDKMARLVWARLVALKREAPMISTRELDEARDDAWAVYERTTATRLQQPGVSNADGLEREGRGYSAFCQKWARACRKWDDEIADEARKPVEAADKPRLQTLRFDPETGEVLEETPAANDGGKQVPRLQLIQWDDLPELKVAWLVKDFLPAGGFAALYGKPGSYKSFVALYLAASVATGTPAFDRETVAGDVIYIAGEGGAGLKKRRDAFAKHYGMAAGTRVFFLRAQLNLRSTFDDARSLIDAVAALSLRPALVIVDTLARAFAGGNENASEDMGAFIAVVGHLQAALAGPTVLLVHHSGKDEARGMRGHSSLFGAVDTELEVVKLSAEGASTRTGKMTVTKQKDGEDDFSVSYRLEHVQLAHLDPNDGSLVVVPDNTPAPAQRRPMSPENKRVLAALETALDGSGVPLGLQQIPRGAKCVKLALWRETYLSEAVGERSSKERMFRRGAKYLQEVGAVGHHADFCWRNND